MTEGERQPRPAPDPRSAALARYLRETARLFSVSADVADAAGTGEAGMALLDAALIAEAMPASDSRLQMLSEAGLFENLPNGEVAFVETPQIRQAIWRPLVSHREGSTTIITKLMATAAAFQEPSAEVPEPGSIPRSAPLQPASLDALGEDVRTARSALRMHRHGPASADLESSRQALVLALDRYVSALENRNFPVPRRIHTELQLLKGLLRWWQ